MKTLSYTSLITLLLFIIALPAQATTPKTLMVFGDSLSAAYGLDEQAGWPYLLQQKLIQQQHNWQVVNLSISGETTAGGLLRLEQAVQRHKPDMVILELGANDGLRGQSLKTMHNNLQLMISQSQAIEAQVVLAGMRIPSNYGKRYTVAFYNVYETLNHNNNIVLIPFLLDGVAEDDSLLLPDRLHPNAQGQKKMLAIVWKYLKPLL